jgi:hypothetical protein
MAGLLCGLGEAVVFIHGHMLYDVYEMVDYLEKIIFYDILGNGVSKKIFEVLLCERFNFHEMLFYLLDPPRKDQSIDHGA